MKLTELVEDILSEGKYLWDAPRVYRNAADANKELKKFPSKLRKYFEVAPDDTRPAGILATNAFYKKAKEDGSSLRHVTYELEGFEIGLDDDTFPDYIKPSA